MIPWSPRRFIVILVSLFLYNWVLVQVFAPAEKEIRVPYPDLPEPAAGRPTSRRLVDGRDAPGRVQEGRQVRGRGGRRKFRTEVPTFANEALATCSSTRTSSPAKPPANRSLLETILFSSARLILLVALFICLFRRAAARRGRRGAGLFGARAQACRGRDPEGHLRGRRRASTKPRTSSSRWSTS